MKKRMIILLLITFFTVIIVLTTLYFIKGKNNSDGIINEAPENIHTQNNRQTDESIDKEERRALLAQVEQMSIEEKVGQLLVVGFQGIDVNDRVKSLIHEFKVGGFIFFAHNLENPEQSLRLINQIKEENEANEFPLFLSVDQEGGRVTRLPNLTRLPTNADIANKYDLEFAYEYGQLLGKQLKAFGFQFNFAPSVDINSNPANEVIGNRSFGSDPKTVGQYGKEVLLGMQSEGIIATVKHFPGHGDTFEDSHTELPEVNKTLDDLKNTELIPFQTAIDAGVDVVMTAHIVMPKLGTDVPATMSEEVVTDLLRERMNFDGVVITDDMTMGAIQNNYDIAESAIQAVNAGVDLILLAHGHHEIVATFEALNEAVQTGEISEERLNESVTRILLLKEKYELNNDIVETIDIHELQNDINQLLKSE